MLVVVSCPTWEVISCSFTSRREFRPVLNNTPSFIMKCLFYRIKKQSLCFSLFKGSVPFAANIKVYRTLLEL